MISQQAVPQVDIHCSESERDIEGKGYACYIQCFRMFPVSITKQIISIFDLFEIDAKESKTFLLMQISYNS